MDKITRARHHESFVSGILKENPLLVMILGTCPALAITKSFEAAFGMGLLFTFVLVCSNVIISALRNIIPDEIRTPAYIVVIAAFVTIVKMLCNAFLPALYTSLGVYLSLLVVNCIVLGRAEAFAGSNTVYDSFLDGVGNGIGYTWAISLIAVIREILGTGMLTFGKIFTFIPLTHLYILKAVSADGTTLYDYSMSLFQNPAGAFIVLGLILAVMAAIKNHKREKEMAIKKAKAFAMAAAKERAE